MNTSEYTTGKFQKISEELYKSKNCYFTKYDPDFYINI